LSRSPRLNSAPRLHNRICLSTAVRIVFNVGRSACPVLVLIMMDYIQGISWQLN
jgi:hypothetical protein